METTSFQHTDEIENLRAAEFFQRNQLAVYERTDRIFAILLPLQWLVGIAAAFFISHLTWNGADSSIHSHILFATFVGGAITSLPLFLTVVYPGRTATRHVVAVSQMLMSGLLIHVMGGRIETHFHVFGSLAFLGCYRDWRVLITGTIVTAADHFLRGWLYPFSMFGILTGSEWRWLEHAGWVVFTDVFLIVSSLRSVREMREIAARNAPDATSEERYRTIIEQMTESVFLLEPESFRVIECNEAFVKLLGCQSIEEAKTLYASDFDPLNPREIHQMTTVLRDERKSMSAERKYLRRDGSWIYVEITGRFITYNNTDAFCVNARDITERKQAQVELKKLALVAEKTQNAVIISDTEGKITWVNDGFTRITGYRPDEVIGYKPGSFLQGEKTCRKTTLAIREAIAQHRPFEGEIYNYGKDGNGYWLSLSIMPITSRKGELKGFIAIEMDITERKAMEEQLQLTYEDLEIRINERTAELVRANKAMQSEVSERRRAEVELNEGMVFLSNVIDNVPNLIFVKDSDGRFTLANRACAELFGTTVEELIGKTVADFNINATDLERVNRVDREVFDTQKEKVISEESLTDADGNVRWFQTVKRPLVIGDGSEQHLLGIATDLTERKILESQLQHSQKLESIGQLAAGIAHEINTPTQYVGDNTRFIRDAFNDFNSILEKYAELLESAQSGEIKSEMIADVQKEIETADLEYLLEEVPNALRQSLDGVSRIAKIVQSMKDFAHPGSADKQSADLNRAIESTVTVARNEWKYIADVETSFDPQLPLVPCYLGEFNQVVLNMVINAAHAISDVVGDGSQGKGKITITTTKVSDNWAEVRIGDSGNGIPPEIQKRIFDPFFTTKEVGKGTGQGLAISHTVVVEKHGGQLSFETESGQGTTFIIRLPLVSTTDSSQDANLNYD